MAKERKIHAVTLTVYVEQAGRWKLPTRTEIADSLIETLEGMDVEVSYGKDLLVQDMTILSAYSNLASDEGRKKGPNLLDLRRTGI